MSLVVEAGAKPILQFTVPYKGTWNSVASNQLSPDSLYNSLNVYIRKGKVRTRPGLTQLNSSVFESPILGGAMAVTSADRILLAVAAGRLYRLHANTNNWVEDTVIAMSNGSYVDTTFIETANQYVAVFAHPSYPLKRWIQGQGVTTIVPSFGTVPSAKSVCTAARRIIALVPPHTLRWSEILTYDNWSTLAVNKIAQTNDTGVCVKAIGTLDFAVYKERSLYLAKAQAGSTANAFNVQFVQHVEGPAGPAAVVDADGLLFHMTKNGRIGIFDGSARVQWIADGIWLYLQSDVDQNYAEKIFGVFDYRLHTVIFYYPRWGDAGQLKGMVVINLPLQGSGIETPNTALGAKYAATAFLGQSAWPVSYGYEMRFTAEIDRTVLFIAEGGDNRSCILDEQAEDDQGRVYSCAMQTGMLPMPELKHTQVSLEVYLERSNGYGFVNLFAVTSDILESENGLIDASQAQLIDLNSNPVAEYLGFNIPSRFFGLRYEWDSTSQVRYNGSTVYGRTLT